jgi:hypothetical protein
MALLAHLTSFDLPSLAVAFVSGLAVGGTAVWGLLYRTGR